MDKNIVDIYDLSDLKIDTNYLTIKIIYDSGKINYLEIDGEYHNKDIVKYNFPNSIYLTNIIKKYNYLNTPVIIKFKIHNLINTFNYISKYSNRKPYNLLIYDEQIIYDKISDLTILFVNSSYYNCGSLQINIYEINNSKLLTIPQYYIYKTNEFYNLESIYYIISDMYDNQYKISFDKPIKKYIIPLVNYNKCEIGMVSLECYKINHYILCYIIDKIKLNNGEIINMTQINKCNCSEYKLYNYIKKKNIFQKKINKCECFKLQKTGLINVKQLKMILDVEYLIVYKKTNISI
jgi:hypothetical protein